MSTWQAGLREAHGVNHRREKLEMCPRFFIAPPGDAQGAEVLKWSGI
jgi:hypothetical protein